MQDAPVLHLVFASTNRHFESWRKDQGLSKSQVKRISTFEDLQGIMTGAGGTASNVRWHVLDGFRGPQLISAARTLGLPLNATFEPVYTSQIPTGERVPQSG